MHHKQKLKRNKLMLILLWVGFLSACDQSKHIKDLNNYISQLRTVSLNSTKKPALSLPIPPKPVVYQAKQKRGPFDQSITMINQGKSIISPLQAFPVSVLRFVGIITQGSIVSAFILSPDNKIYLVKEGEKIGEYHGKITRIYPDKIEITEEDPDKVDELAYHTVVLQLKDESK